MKGKRRVHYLELAKQGRGRKIKAQHGRKFQENDVNRELEKRGRVRWSRISIWKFLTKACKENKGEEEETFLLSWFKREELQGTSLECEMS